jgi:hypothetical protein
VASFGRGVVDDQMVGHQKHRIFLVHGDGEKDCAKMDMPVHVCTPHLLQTLYIRGTGINLDRLSSYAAEGATSSVWKTVHPSLRTSGGPEQAFDAKDN